MELLKLAIRYYIKVTGKTCYDFYNGLKEVLAVNVTEQTGDDWLRHKLLERVITDSYTLDDVEKAQDTMSTYFIDTYVSNVQEYSVDPIWGKEVIKSVSKYLDDIDSTVFWDIHSLSDTMFSGSKLDTKNIFLSHGNAQVVSSKKVKKGITYFAFDFVEGFDLDKLPEKLQDAIRNDKPLVLLCSIPFKKEDLKNAISDLMYSDGFTIQSLDVHYQYLYRMVKFVKQFNLKNCYIGLFGDTSLYTDNTNSVFLKYFRDVLNFKEGFCFSLKDFNSTLMGVNSLHFSLWNCKESEDKPILLVKKRLISKTKVEDGEAILFEENRVSVVDWLQPKDVLFYKQAPIMLNYATFKGGEKFNKIAKFSNKIAENAMGTMTVTKTMQDIKNTLLLSGPPSSKSYVNITEENFWRCVAYFAFSVLVTPTWNNNKLNISAPNEKVEGYEKWCKNAVLLFLLDNKSMFSSLRNVQWEGVNTNIDNKLFFVDKELIEMATNDSLIAKQLDGVPSNDFVVRQLQMARLEWTTETAQLYEFCLDFVQRTLDQRKLVRYAEDTDVWNAGFSQIKSVFGQSDVIFKSNFDRLYMKYVDSLRADLSKFGFLQDR